MKNIKLLGLAAAGLLTTSMAFADQPGKGDFAFSLNPFSSCAVGAQEYSVGYFVSDRIMPFATFSFDGTRTGGDEGDDEGDDLLTLAGGTRIYFDQITERVRPFAGAALEVQDDSDTDVSLGGFVGAEAMITSGFSVSGIVGMDVVNKGCSGCGTDINLGSSAVQLNLYF